MNKILSILFFIAIMTASHAQSDPSLSQPTSDPTSLTSYLSPLTTHLSEKTSHHSGDREYDVLFHEAMLQRQKGHHDACFDLLSRCLELRPDAAEAHYFQAQYFSEMHMPDSALHGYQRAADLCPDNATYMATLAQAYIQKSDYAKATTVVERLYETDKSRQELLETLYRLYVQQEDYVKAVGVLDRIEAIDGKSERTSLAKSGLYLQMERQQEAIDEMRALWKRYPNDLNYQTLYAQTLLMNEQGDEALQLLERVLADEPDNVRALVAMRNYYIGTEDKAAADSLTLRLLLSPKATAEDKIYQMRQIISENEQQGGDSTQVLALFDRMLAQPEPDADIAELKAAYMDLKKMPRDSVAAAFEQVLSIAPDRSSARMRLVQMAWEDQDDERIISLCQQARQYNPEEMGFYYFQGVTYYRQEDTEHALEAFQNGISVINQQSSPELVSDFYSVMGDLLHQKGLEQRAFEAYDSCLQWKPDNIGCLNNYAYFLALKGERLEEAEQMSYKTVKAEPKNATYLDTYAWILFCQQRFAEARIYIDQTLQNDSLPSSDVLEHAGDIYAHCGEMEKAVDFWQQALEKTPANKLLARKVKRKKYIKP